MQVAMNKTLLMEMVKSRQQLRNCPAQQIVPIRSPFGDAAKRGIAEFDTEGEIRTTFHLDIRRTGANGEHVVV